MISFKRSVVSTSGFPGRMMPIGMLAVALTAGTSAAATITWQSPATVSSTSILDSIPSAYSGATLSQSVYFGHDTSTYSVTTPEPQTINFTHGSASYSGPSGSATELFYSGPQKISGVTNPTSDTNFNNVLLNDGWASSGHSYSPQTLQIGGLTTGTKYAIELLAFDGRSSSSARTEEFADTVNATGNNSTSFSTYTAHSVIGTFTAGASTQDVYVWQTTTGVSSWDTTVSAFTLYALPAPEPATLGMLAIGGMGLLLAGRRKKA
ncbi:MAG: PEP-CTERM sorting domain-containing protein [Phycisphaerales bacterium]|nr:PEP-CTERM sorting domain-containing protein [Phycisphaerales bacterium]